MEMACLVRYLQRLEELTSFFFGDSLDLLDGYAV
jgi:hypothetical protein